MKNGHSLTTLLLLVFIGQATADDLNRLSLPDVLITATRTETQREDVTAAISAVSGTEIEQRDQISTAEALRYTPGTDITEFGSPGQSAFASIRGAAPDQVLVLLDGVEVNAPTTGQFDFSNLTTDNIDRIEILRGGGGALYGSQAIGGVINVLTPRGEGPLRFSLRGEGGSGGTHREVLGVSGARGSLALSGTVSSLLTDGFRRINDDYSNFSTVWRADADVLPKGTLRGFLRYTNARAGLPNFNVIEGRLDPDAHSRSDFFLAKSEWVHELAQGVRYRVSGSIVRDNQRYRDDELDEEDMEVEPVIHAHFPTEILTAETQVDYLWRNMALTTVGVEFNERSAHIFKSEPGEEEEEDREIKRFNANRSNVAAYVQQQLWGFADTVRAVGGLRYDHYDRFGDEVTLSGSGSYLFRPTSTRVRLGYAEGFRVPTFDELFEPTLGNPRLQPEHSWEINAGFVQEFEELPLRFESTYFYRKVHNLIEEVADQLPGAIRIPEETNDENMPLTRNLDARLQGVEVIAHAQPVPWLALNGNYTYLDFQTPTGTLLNRPHHRGSFVATATRNNLLALGDQGTFSLLLYAVGRRDSANPREDFEVEKAASYARTDIAFSYRFGGRLAPFTLHATVRNLFDQDYSESLGFRAPPLRFLVGVSYPLS